MATVLVTGATGNVGSAVVQELLKMGEPVRAFVRDPARAAERLGDGVDLAVGDFEDAESIRRALDGVDRVLLSSGDSPAKVSHETAVIDVAAEAGVRRVVKVSTMLAEAGSPLPPFDWNGRSEDHLRASGLPSVVLQSCFYMTNLLASADPVRFTGKLFAPAEGGKVGMIDPRDTGAVAAVVLTTEGHEGQTYALSGPEAITYERVAEDLSAATGRPVEFVNVPEEAMKQGLIEAGSPDWLVDHLPKLFGRIRNGDLEVVTDGVRALTGGEPRSFTAWARDHASAFAG